MLLRFVYIILLILRASEVCSSENTTPNYDLCKTGPAITSLNGRIYATIGEDCNRIILAPKGFRIEVNITENTRIAEEKAMDIFDGATTVNNPNHVRISRHRVTENLIVVSSSNAVLIHADKITSRYTKVEIIYKMFRHQPERCACLPVTQGDTTCSFAFHFIRGDIFTRVCHVDCGQDRFIVNRYHSGDFRMQCYLGDPKYNEGSEVKWRPLGQFETFLDDHLITCSRIYPTTRLKFGYKMRYVNVSCGEVNETEFKNKIQRYISSVQSVANLSQCFKSQFTKDNINCIVESVNISSCRYNGRSAEVLLLIRDNTINSTNETIVFQRYHNLYSQYASKIVPYFLTFIKRNLTVNNTQATSIFPAYFIKQPLEDCPDNAGFKIDYERRKFGCLNCPPNFVDQLTGITICKECENGTRRNTDEATCVPGPRSYPEPSQKYCKHTCDLGKYFNYNSSICEWCPYGTYQNSTTTLNPQCTPCSGGRTTGFIGARNISECIDLCPAGSYLKYTKCLKCGVGEFMPNASHRLLNCYLCPDGYTTLDVGTVDGCVKKCIVGEYFNMTLQNCTLCPNNTYQDEINDTNTRICKKCPQNTTTAQTGSASFSDCLGPCSSGQYIDIASQKCLPCVVNTYHDKTQHLSFSCESCGQHKITLTTGATNVSECIYTCAKGRFFNLTSENCEQCPINTYQNELGKDGCKSCQGNTFTLKTGSENCISPCALGEFLNKSAEKCMKCLRGFYQNISEYTSEICQPCPIDSYSDKTGQPNCTSCKNGSITLVTGASDMSECIESCQPGYYLNKTLRSCQKCAKGFYQDKTEYRDEFCTKCESANLTTLGMAAKSSEECVGYCKSSPCLNGAICSNIENDFNCTCPKFLTGKQCETIVDRDISDTMEISIRFPALIWNGNLGSGESDEFKELASRIEKIIRAEFESDPTFRTVKVVGFLRGSVISDVQFAYVGGVTFVTPVDMLTKVISNGRLGNLTVDPGAVNITNYTCSQPLGMENRRIPDKAITSGIGRYYHPPKNARLNHPGPGWAPIYFSENEDYLQVDFQEELWLTGIATQGSSYGPEGSWLRAFYFETSFNGRDWSYYLGEYTVRHIFVANVDIDTVVRNTLPYPVKTRYVRITEYHFKSWISFRVEFYGCPIPKTLPLPTMMPPRTKQPTVENNATTHPSKETITLPSQPTVENNATTHPSKETIALPSQPTVQNNATTHPSSTAVTPDEDKDDSNVGLIVGVTIAVLAVCVIVVLGVVWWTKRNKKAHSLSGSSVGAIPLKET